MPKKDLNPLYEDVICRGNLVYINGFHYKKSIYLKDSNKRKNDLSSNAVSATSSVSSIAAATVSSELLSYSQTSFNKSTSFSSHLKSCKKSNRSYQFFSLQPSNKNIHVLLSQNAQITVQVVGAQSPAAVWGEDSSKPYHFGKILLVKMQRKSIVKSYSPFCGS